MTTRRTMNRVVYSLAAVLAASAPCVVLADAAEELDDAASRIQYAYYTADERALAEVLTVTGDLEVDSKLAALKAYHLAYGQWRLGELYAQSAEADGARSNAGGEAARAVEACVQHAEEAVRADARFAEAYAIRAVCEFTSGSTWRGSAASREKSAAACRSKPLEMATALAPENPRVLLIEALCTKHAADPEKFRTVVAAFESAPPRTTRTPDWGHAEALTMLGQSYLTRGDPVAARDALERALVIAPDYRAAQELLQTAATRPR